MNPGYKFKPRPRAVVGLAQGALLLTGCMAAAFAAAPPTPVAAAAAAGPGAAATAPACGNDLRAFKETLDKDGYWRHSDMYGYGYPMYGFAYAEGPPVGSMGTQRSLADTDYWLARPGYEVRTLLASAEILAQRGQQSTCEAILGEARGLYKSYADGLRKGNVPRAETAGWRDELAAAQPISSALSYRSDQLIGTGVVTPRGESLGSVNDLVMSPVTGKISYIVIGHGGLFGIDEKYVPVPWDDFKATAQTQVLVLDATHGTVDGAPRVKMNQFGPPGEFVQETRRVDDYWADHIGK